MARNAGSAACAQVVRAPQRHGDVLFPEVGAHVLEPMRHARLVAGGVVHDRVECAGLLHRRGDGADHGVAVGDVALRPRRRATARPDLVDDLDAVLATTGDDHVRARAAARQCDATADTGRAAGDEHRAP